MAFLFGFGFLKSGKLGLGQQNALLRNLGFEGFQALFRIAEIVTQPDRADPERRNGEPPLPQLVRDPNLTPSGLIDGKLHDCAFDLRRHPVGKDRLAPAHLGQRQVAALVVKLL